MPHIAGAALIALLVADTSPHVASTQLFGAGGIESCAHWLSTPANEAEGDVWALGYWSGLNTFNDVNHLVGRTTDGEGVLGEIKKLCRESPSMLMAKAVAETWRALRIRNQ